MRTSWSRTVIVPTRVAPVALGATTKDTGLSPERCPVIVGNTMVYLDENHMTLEYARLLAPAIGALTDRALAHN